MTQYTANTAAREVHKLAKLCEENNQIEPELYDKYQVKRGLREPNGKGVLTGLTRISDVNAVKVVDGKEVPCAGSLAYRGYDIKDLTEDFLKEVNAKGEYIREKLKTMANVSEVRGMGMMIGIVTEKDNAKEIAKKCVENGLLILTAKNLLRLLPPLNITYEEIDRGLNILKKVMEEN